MSPMLKQGLLLLTGATLAACGGEAADANDNTGTTAFVGATLIDGTGTTPVAPSVIIVQDGVIQSVGPAESIEVPGGATVVDVAGRFIVPGFINAHGHVGQVRGLQSGQYSRENVLDQLALYARYGVTTVVSLGDDEEEGIVVRDEQDSPDLNRARLYVAGPVLGPRTPEEAVAVVQEIADMGVDWAKIRIDSNLGQSQKMAPEVYQAVIDEAHRLGIEVAAHIIELEDAKALVRAGADLIAHSVRDLPVDEELISLMRERRICLSPTLTREVSTFVYGSRPDFFDDPFFQREVDPAILTELEDPERQRRTRESQSAQYWQAQLPQAMENMKALSDAGVGIAMGTDSGVAGRFQGYFEHLEMEMMVDAGMSPMDVIVASTGEAARCMGLFDLGTLELGKRADLIVLENNPLDDISNTKSIESVWINGNQVPQREI